MLVSWLSQKLGKMEMCMSMNCWDDFGTPIPLDRNSSATGKSHGGGVCLYVNKNWCNIVTIQDTPDIEMLCSFYSPWEFPQLFFTVVYIHQRANVSKTADILSQSIHRLDSLSPDAPRFILGDFKPFKMGKTCKNFH